MEDIELMIAQDGEGRFMLRDEQVIRAEMKFAIIGLNMIVYHTEVAEDLEGKGIAGKLFGTMISYVRANHLMVIPLCPYTQGQFMKYPEMYQDIWQKDEALIRKLIG